MKVSLDKLTEDLIAANKVACDAVENITDGGSANLDCVFLKIPRARENSVLDAIRRAGLHCRKKTEWIGKGYMITPTTSGQGDKRAIGVREMAKNLRNSGWDVLVFEKVD